MSLYQDYSMYQSIYYIRLFLAIFVLFLFPMLTGGSAFASPHQPGANSTQITGLETFWSARADDLATLSQEAKTLQNRAEVQAAALTGQVRDVRSQFARLTTLFQASRGHPTEQMTLVQQMRGLHSRLKRVVGPLEDIAASIKLRLDEVGQIKEDLDSVYKSSAADGIDLQGASEAGSEALRSYSRSLTQTRKQLQAASSRLEGILAPARGAKDRMAATVEEIEGSLTGIWEVYYLTPSGNTLDALASSPSLLADWLTSLNSRMAFAYPQDTGGWLRALGIFAVAACIMGVLGFLGYRGAANLPEHWRRACERALRGPWVRAGLGLSLLMASGNQYGGTYFGFVLVGALILIAGIAGLTWRLRVAVAPALESKPSPLRRLFIPAAVGVLMLLSDLPALVLGIVWGVSMLIFLVRMYSINRRGKASDKLPFLERLTYGSSLYFGLASLMVVGAGYAHLSILVFMLLFALASIMTLGNALTGLLDILAENVFGRDEKPVRLAIAQSLAIPLAWLLSLLCTAPWIWTVPGAQYIIQNVLVANYTVGEASFDFSRVIFIALLFFLFRAFVSLGKASLEHLPERIPTVEKGVIPPLRTMVTYSFWALFALISLGLLGVNFTSLAVVAGGLSVGIGFGMQNLFNNLVSGLMLIFGRTILVGDYVQVGGIEGTVRAISIRSTTIETPEQSLVYVPNSNIMAGQFSNVTRGTRRVRRTIDVGVAYGSDTKMVSDILLSVAKQHVHVLNPPEPFVYFTNFADSSLNFTLYVCIDDFSNAGRTVSDLRFAIEQAFTERGIDIPFPQLTLHTNTRTEPPREESGADGGSQPVPKSGNA